MKKIALVLLAFFVANSIKAQEKFTISGTLKDGKSTETLFGANVYISELKIGTNTNEYGFYSLTIPKGEYTLKISYLGFGTLEEKISVTQNIKKDFALTENNQTLEEVKVESYKKRSEIKNSEMSVNKLSIQTIKKMPAVLGEVDIIKSILQLPGVTNAGEGQSGFNVRGGSAD